MIRLPLILLVLLLAGPAWSGPADVAKARRLLKQGETDEAIQHIRESLRKAQPQGSLQQLKALLDDARYARADEGGTPEAYAAYLAKHVGGRHAEQALILLCRRAWEAAEGTTDPTARPFEDFAATYPECPQIGKAEATAAARAPSGAADLQRAVEELAGGFISADLGPIRLVVTPALGPEGCATGLSQLVAEQLSIRLLEEEAFEVMERDRLDQVLDEARFQLSDLVDSASAAELGAFLGAEAVVVGSATPVGRDTAFNLRLVRVETASNEAAARSRIEVGRDLAELQRHRVRCPSDVDPTPVARREQQRSFGRPVGPASQPLPSQAALALPTHVLSPRECSYTYRGFRVVAFEHRDTGPLLEFAAAHPTCPQAEDARLLASEGFQDGGVGLSSVLNDAVAQLAHGTEQRLPGERVSVVVADLLDAAACETELGRFLSDTLATTMVGIAPFEVMERGRLDGVLAELRTQQSDLFSDAEAVEAGRLLGAQAIVVGSVNRVGKSAMLNLRLLDIASGQGIVGATPRLPLDRDLDAMLRAKVACPGW